MRFRGCSRRVRPIHITVSSLRGVLTVRTPGTAASAARAAAVEWSPSSRRWPFPRRERPARQPPQQMRRARYNASLAPGCRSNNMVVGRHGRYRDGLVLMLVALGALAWTPHAVVNAAGVDLDSLPDIDDDQFWSAYKASIPYQDYVRLGREAADYVDRFGPRRSPGENDTLFRFRRFLRIQKELDKRLLLYYELNARDQQRELEENRELEQLSHQLHASAPVAPGHQQQQQQQQHRQHRFGQYQLPYPNQQMLDDVRPYPHEDTLPNDFSFGGNGDDELPPPSVHYRNAPRENGAVAIATEGDGDETTAHQRVIHHDLTNVANSEGGSGGKAAEIWERKAGQEAFAFAPPDPRFYDGFAGGEFSPRAVTATTPGTVPLVPPRHVDTPIFKGVAGATGDEEKAATATLPNQLLVQQRNSHRGGGEDTEETMTLRSEHGNTNNNGGSVGGFRFNMVGKWPALGTGIGEKQLVVGNPEYGGGGGGGGEDDTLQVQPVQQHSLHHFAAGDSAGVYIIAIVAGISAAATVGLIAFAIGWYNLQKHVKSSADVEYPAYGVTGPNKELSPSGDRRLAQSAQMYHYQHQKQQIIAMESRAAAGDRHGSISQADSDEENEEGDYTVYECPGLAPTGEMEVKNPMFNDEPTPAQTPQVKADQPQN